MCVGVGGWGGCVCVGVGGCAGVGEVGVRVWVGVGADVCTQGNVGKGCFE